MQMMRFLSYLFMLFYLHTFIIYCPGMRVEEEADARADEHNECEAGRQIRLASSVMAVPVFDFSP